MTTPDPRAVRLAGAHNVRDLGGLPVAGGRRVRPGVLYRGDALGGLTPDDIDLLAGSLGLRVVLDLRSGEEATAEGPTALGARGVEYAAYPLHYTGFARDNALAGARSETDDLAASYLEFARHSPDTVAGLVRRLLADGGTPAIVCCTMGKDRTGIVTAVLLATLGVEAETIVADYVLTATAVQSLLAGMKDQPLFRDFDLSSLPAWAFAAEPVTMRHFLELVAGQWGSAAGYLRHCGITDGELAALADLLLEPAP